MKTLLCSFLLWFAIVSVQAQSVSQSVIPAAVRTAFAKTYSSAQKVKWDKEKSHYEASFEQAGVESSVLLDEKGKILETEVGIPVSQLPQGVVAYVVAHHKGQKIKEAAKITDAAGKVTYEAEVRGKDLLFDENGEFVKEGKD